MTPEAGMKFRTLMANLALDRSNEACLAISGDLAQRFEAYVIGIAASDLKPPLYYAEGEQAEAILRQERSAIRERIDHLEKTFRARLANKSKGLGWRSAIDFSARFVSSEARAADILVTEVGTEPNDPYSAADPNDLVMTIGRPLLVVPETVQWLDTRHILVAWKDTREARRAIVDALPLLSIATEVTVVEILEEGRERSATQSRLKDVVSWLQQHSISADTLVIDRPDDVTTRLDEAASDAGAGVIVAGAYGHSRFREWVLGGVTRYLMAQRKRCVLLSR
jgi:nucleotide-binding universal stress UspA family protein